MPGDLMTQQWPQAGFNNFTMAMAQAAQAQQAQENMMRLQQVRIITTITNNNATYSD